MWVYLSCSSSFYHSLSLSVIIHKQFQSPRSPLSSPSLSQVISFPSSSVSVHHLAPLHVSIFPLQSHAPVSSSVSSTKGGSCYVNLLFFSSSSIDYSTEHNSDAQIVLHKCMHIQYARINYNARGTFL